MAHLTWLSVVYVVIWCIIFMAFNIEHTYSVRVVGEDIRLNIMPKNMSGMAGTVDCIR